MHPSNYLSIHLLSFSSSTTTVFYCGVEGYSVPHDPTQQESSSPARVSTFSMEWLRYTQAGSQARWVWCRCSSRGWQPVLSLAAWLAGCLSVRLLFTLNDAILTLLHLLLMVLRFLLLSSFSSERFSCINKMTHRL